MPAQQGRRLDEEAIASSAGEQSYESRQHRPIRRFECWSTDLASEHRHLRSQHHDVDGQVCIVATGETYQLKDAKERPVEE